MTAKKTTTTKTTTVKPVNKVKVIATIDLSSNDLDYLDDFFSMRHDTLTVDHQKNLLRIYNKVFHLKRQPTQCTPCWVTMLDQLHEIYREVIK